ncbi:hypothetical protein FE633_09970 [Streptomyces montanus]|uniref:Deoxyribonuclease NucA/NucB domain-containing protein n=1 Tax=Streptomyces montanus TaxID=2580423 RepID=A0A5R9FUD5_9ACTN|nr:hypothetical protein [Streptomyces montanus]TLS46259.1 hypothetical protein FE633_09970 [Streptomyces montanus]
MSTARESDYMKNFREKERIRLRQEIWKGPDDLPPPPADPPVEGGTWQADEFPFASTREGMAAARRNLDAGGTFNGSVQWVNQNQNRDAGNMLKEFYKRDRILYRPARQRSRIGTPLSCHPS